MSFNKRVWELTKKVPKGKVTTYKEIARKLKTKAYRAVGNALNKNRSRKVPCHRVIRSDGYVGGFAHGTRKKQRILRKEGIKIHKGKINLKTYFYRL